MVLCLTSWRLCHWKPSTSVRSSAVTFTNFSRTLALLVTILTPVPAFIIATVLAVLKSSGVDMDILDDRLRSGVSVAAAAVAVVLEGGAAGGRLAAVGGRAGAADIWLGVVMVAV